MPDEQLDLVRAMMGFSRKIRQRWASRMSGIPGGERLTERDWGLLEWVVEKGTVQFSEAVQYAKGDAKSVGSSEAAVTAAIGRMSKEWGLLRTKRTKEDERRKTISPSEKGRRLVGQRDAIRNEMYAKIIESWKPLERGLCRQVTAMFERGLERADVVFGNDS